MALAGLLAQSQRKTADLSVIVVGDGMVWMHLIGIDNEGWVHEIYISYRDKRAKHINGEQ